MIDERGYFNEDPKKVAHEQRTSEQSVLKCLALIQSLEPLGVGARDLSECLLIQVQERYPNQPLLKLLITEYLYLVAEGDLELIAKETQSSLAEIKTNVALIKTLNPNPGNGFASSQPDFIRPDFEVIKQQDRLEIKLITSLKVKLNPAYQKLKKQLNLAEEKVFNKYWTEAQQLISVIDKRLTSLELVAKAIVRHQQAYLLQQAPLKKLILQDLSQLTDLHVSTICRMVNNKYYLLDNRVYPLSTLLCKGQIHSVAEIKTVIQQFINQEGKIAVSDKKITEYLNTRGYPIARRTVAKYRREMGHLSSYERKVD